MFFLPFRTSLSIYLCLFLLFVVVFTAVVGVGKIKARIKHRKCKKEHTQNIGKRIISERKQRKIIALTSKSSKL